MLANANNRLTTLNIIPESQIAIIKRNTLPSKSIPPYTNFTKYSNYCV